MIRIKVWSRGQVRKLWLYAKSWWLCGCNAMSLFSLLFLFYDLGWIWIIESMLLEEFYDSWIVRFIDSQRILFFYNRRKRWHFINYESVNLFLAIIEKKLYRCEFVDNDGNSKMMLFVFLDSMINVTSDFSIVVRLIQSDYDLPFLFREPFVYDCSIISLYRMKII